MSFEAIRQFFQNPSPTYLNQELAVCYVLSVLLREDSYGTELIQLLEKEYPAYRLSDTVLYSVLQFLEGETFIQGSIKKLEGRGRPRRMYQILPHAKQQARELAQFWQDYVMNNPVIGKGAVPCSEEVKS